MSVLPSLAWNLQRSGLRARTGTGTLTTLAVVSFTITSWLALVVAGGTWMFYERAVNPPAALRDFAVRSVGEQATNSLVFGFLIVHVVLAVVACAFVVPVIVTVTANTAVLGASGREQRLAALRLIGLSNGDVTRMTMLETGAQTLVGLSLGTLLSVITAPLWRNVTFQTVPLQPWDMLLPWWGYPAVWFAVLLLALVASWWGLKRVRVSPLGVARRQVPKALRMWRIVVFLLIFAAGLTWLGMNPANKATTAEPMVLTGLVIMGVVGSISVIAPLILQILARLGKWAAPGTVAFVGASRVAADARTTWRRTSAMAFLAVLVGALAMNPYGLGSEEETVMAQDVGTGIIITLVVGFVLVAISTLLTQASENFETASLNRDLNRAGVSERFQARVVAAQTLVPLAIVSVVGVFLGSVVGYAVFQSGAVISWARVTQASGLLLGGFALSVGALVAVSPIRRRTLASASRRND